MKLANRPIVAGLSLGLFLALGACTKTATNPETGQPVDINEPDPTTAAEKAAAYKKLEDAKAENEKWRKYAEEHGNTGLVEKIDENLEMIADAKDDLGYEPPKKAEARTESGAVAATSASAS